jgi:3-oxoacyl-[acyl-carrier-protein] synthase-1
VLQQGHAGGCHAIDAAIRTIRMDPTSACVVCGVDSYLAPDTLEWLEETDQLHGAGPKNNAWGFIPGEGAGALLLMAADTCRRARLQPVGQIAAVGLGKEKNLIRTDTVCTGLGLTDAFKGALAGLDGDQRVTDVYCDLNGEPYRADEFGFSVLRTRERFVSASDCVTPADCWGDVGAASVPLGIILACAASAKRYSNGSHSLVWASSESGERGAALIQGVARS